MSLSNKLTEALAARGLLHRPSADGRGRYDVYMESADGDHVNVILPGMTSADLWDWISTVRTTEQGNECVDIGCGQHATGKEHNANAARLGEETGEAQLARLRTRTLCLVCPTSRLKIVQNAGKPEVSCGRCGTLQAHSTTACLSLLLSLIQDRQ